MPEFNVEINLQATTDAITEAQNALNELLASIEEVNSSSEDINSEGMENMADGASNVAQNTDEASKSMEDLGDKTDKKKKKMQETAESSAGLGTAIAGVAGGLGLDAVMQTSDNIDNSWKRLGLTFANTGVSIDEIRAKSSALSQETGRSGAQIRDYFNRMGIAGITNTDLIKQSFSGLSAKAYQTGNSIDTMSNMLNRMVMSGTAGNRMLFNLGLSTKDLAEAMGVTEDEVKDTFKSLSETERLEVLNKAMGDGAEANELYKNSYSGLKEQASIALAGLAGAVGSSILPVIIPAIQTAKSAVETFTSIWKGLPTPVTSVFGAFAGGIVALTTVVGVLGTLGKVGSSVVTGLKSLRTGYTLLTSGLNSARTAITTLRTAESLSAGVKTLLTSVLGAERVATLSNAAAKASAIAPTTGLAVAENSLLLPLLLLVGAIIAVVAVLWYLYNNNETVRQGIDNLINSVKAIVNFVVGQVMSIIQQIVARVSMIINIITALMAGNISLQQAIIMVWTIIQNTIQTALTFILGGITTFGGELLNRIRQAFYNVLVQIGLQVMQWRTRATSGVKSLVNNIYNTLTSLPNKVRSAISGITSILTKPFSDAWNQIKPYIDNVKNGINTLNSINPFSGFEGFSDTDVGFAGFDNYLNKDMSNNISSNREIINNNITIKGIVEKEASEYIVDSLNNHIKKQNLIRGV